MFVLRLLTSPMRTRVVEQRAHAADRQREELVDLRADAVVDGSHGLGASHTSEVKILVRG